MSGFCSKKEKFCLMSGLKHALSEVTSFLPDNVSGLKKIIFRRGLIFFSRVTKLFVLPRSMFSYIMLFGLPYLFSQYLFNYLFRDFIKGSFSFILCSSFLFSSFSISISSFNIRISSLSLYRSSHRRCSVRKDVLRNFPKFTGKHLCQSLFLIKFQASGLRPATLLKTRLWHRCFPVNLAKFLRTPVLQNNSGRLLLFIY